MVAQRSNVPKLSPTTSDESQLIEQLANSLAALYDGINRVSEQGDLDTADLLNEVSKSLWPVEAHLQSRGIAAIQGQRPTR